MFIRSLLMVALTSLSLLSAAPKKTKAQQGAATAASLFRAEDYLPSTALADQIYVLLNQYTVDTSKDSLEVITKKLENFDSRGYQFFSRSMGSCQTAKGDELTRLELFLKPRTAEGRPYPVVDVAHSLVFHGQTSSQGQSNERPVDQLEDELNAFKQYEQIIAKNSLKLMKAPKVALLHLPGKPLDVKAGNYAVLLEHATVDCGLEDWDSLHLFFGNGLSLEFATELVIVLEQMMQVGYIPEALTTDGQSISVCRWDNFSRTPALGMMSKDIAEGMKEACTQALEQDPVYGKVTCCMVANFVQQKFEKCGFIEATLELLHPLTALARQSKSEVKQILNGLRSRLVQNLVILVNEAPHDIEAALRKALSNYLTPADVKLLSAAVAQGAKTPITAATVLQWLDKEAEEAAENNDQTDTGTN